MSDLFHSSSQVKINDTKYQPPCIIYILFHIYSHRHKHTGGLFFNLIVFLFSKYTANNNNREPLGKSEAMKNAKVTSTGQALPSEGICQQTLSLGTLKWLHASK